MNERISILYENNVLDKEVYENIEFITNFIEEQITCSDEDKINMFWTHLAMALQRNNKDEEITDLDQEMVNELSDLENYSQALEIVDNIEKMINVKISEGERAYIILHLCNVI